MKKGKMFFAGAAAVMTFVLASCGGAAVEGTWVEPIPGMDGEQGFSLEKGGRADRIIGAETKSEAKRS